MLKEFKQSANKDFFSRIISITIPVTLQNLLGSSRNLIDTVMIGTLGVTQVAAVGAAGKPFFVLLVVLLGLTNGSGILIAQYWGKKDSEGVARFVILSTTLTISISIVLSILVNLFCDQIIGFTTTDPEVVKYGSEYLRIISTNLILQSIILSFNIGLRSTNQVKKCTLTSLIGVSSNIFLNYILIFGHLGLEPMGLKGAAYGTLLSCLIETIMIVVITLFFNTSFKLSITKFKSQITMVDFKKNLQLALPLALNGFAWAGGTYIYFIIYGRMGNDELAVVTMLEPLISLMVSFFSGLATGAGILLGHSLGEGNFNKAWIESKLLVAIGFLLGILIFIFMYLVRDTYMGFFSSMPQNTIIMATKIYGIHLFYLIFISINMVIIVGVLRSGGDTRFVMFLDMGCQWFVGIPLGILAAFVWNLSLFWVVLLINSETIVKMLISSKRMIGKKWIRDLTN